MKSPITIILLISLFGLYNSSSAQNSFERRLSIKKDQLKKDILKEVNADLALGKYADSGMIEIIAVPSYKFRCSSAQLINDLRLDSFFSELKLGYGIINNDGHLLAIANTGKIANSNAISLQTIYDTPSLPDDWSNELKMINKISTGSSTLFFISLFPKELPRYWPLGYIESGKIKFIDQDLNTYESIGKLIEKKYGSVEKYTEMMDIQMLAESRFKNLKSKKDAEKFVKENYTWIMENTNDTLRAINSFIRELDSTTKLKDAQKVLLKKTIINTLRSKSNDYCGHSGIYFYGQDILPDIMNTLTYKQYCLYIKAQKVNKIFLNYAKEMAGYLVD